MSSRLYGADLFQTMCLELATVLGADATLIGTLAGKGFDRVQTLMAVTDGQVAENFTYRLSGTPCEKVLAQGLCAYPDGVDELFPRGTLLVDLDVAGYVGVPLLDASGAALGIMAALYRVPLVDVDLAKSVLQIFAARVGSEIEHLRAEKAHEDTRVQYFNFVNASSDLVSYWKMPPDLRTDLPVDEQVKRIYQSVCVECNRACWEYMGLSCREDLLGVRYGDLLAQDTMDEAFAAFIGNGYQLSGREIHEKMVDGRDYFGQSTWYGRVEDGCLTHVWVNSRNMTDLKLAEAQLRHEMAFTDTALDAQQDTFFLFEIASGKAVRWNRSFREISGYTDEEIAVLPAPASYYAPSDHKRIGVFLDRLLEEGTGSIELNLLRKSGETVPTEYRVSVINDAEGAPRHLISIGRDIRERREAETETALLQMQVIQTQKLDSIGRLAGGVAHDLNNLLSPILGYGEILHREMDDDDPQRNMVEQMLEAGQRARNLVRQLLAFSRRQTLQFTGIDLNRLLTGFEGLLRRTIREDVRINLDLAEDLPPISGDPGQLEQVIMNLTVNAQDAMPDGGELAIGTAFVNLDDRFLDDREGVEPGPYVMLTCSDTGCGMEEDTISHIFEPFFTTKAPGKGTGLGLSTVFGIIKQHGGYIWACSRTGAGSTFRIYLPVDETVTVPDGREILSGEDQLGTETILLVEDDTRVRDMARNILERLGYDVVEADGGQAALEILQAHSGAIHLLLTDVIMPGLNGYQLYEEISRTHPDIGVLFMSGYNDDVIAQKGVVDPDLNFIQKPFSISTLAAKVRAALGH